MRHPIFLAAVVLTSACGAAPEGDEPGPVATVATLRIVHVGFGTRADDLRALDLDAALAAASAGLVGAHVVASHHVPFPAEDADHDYAAVRARLPWLAEQDVAPVFYYEQPFARLRADLEAAIAASGAMVSAPDLIVVTTDAQLEGRGSFLGEGRPVIVVETRTLGAWARGGSYFADRLEAAAIRDVAVHEVGHYMGLGHACQECSGPEDEARCAACPRRNNVMSTCRPRPSDGAPPSRFAACALEHIRSEFIPALESGRPMQAPACADQRP